MQFDSVVVSAPACDLQYKGVGSNTTRYNLIFFYITALFDSTTNNNILII